jgi:hypothetical protein
VPCAGRDEAVQGAAMRIVEAFGQEDPERCALRSTLIKGRERPERITVIAKPPPSARPSVAVRYVGAPLEKFIKVRKTPSSYSQ